MMMPIDPNVAVRTNVRPGARLAGPAVIGYTGSVVHRPRPLYGYAVFSGLIRLNQHPD